MRSFFAFPSDDQRAYTSETRVRVHVPPPTPQAPAPNPPAAVGGPDAVERERAFTLG